MTPGASTPVAVISAPLTALILSSAHLREQLLPQGLMCSPYEVLDYRSTLVLHDQNGRKATFQRIQRIRFLQDGVAAILDHFWGAGVLLTEYTTTAGRIGDS